MKRKSVTFFATLVVCFNLLFFSAVGNAAPLQGEKKPVRVYVDVVGDLFHLGHVEFFKKARSLGDYLVVGVHSDEVVEGYKRRPVMNLEERVRVIEACKYVDEVILDAPLNPSEEYLKANRIDFVVHGNDFNKDLLGQQYGDALKMGIFRSVPYTPGISSTQIIQRVIQRYNQGELEYK